MAELTTTAYTDDVPPGSLITRDGQMQWAGLLLGPGTPYEIDRGGLTGWEDLPEYDTGDADHPTAHGAWPGARYAKPRKVGGTVHTVPSANSAEASLTATRILRQALLLGDEERWLAVRLHGETLAVRARISQRVLAADRTYATQGVSRASVQWYATDPRRYSVTEHTAVTGAPQPESGLTWPLTWPLYWGEAASTGDVTAANGGSAPTHPVLTFTGPCAGPTVTDRTTARRLRYQITLAAGDELVVDTAAGTVTLNGTASRRHTAAADSSPEELFAFEPGRAQLAFRPDTHEAGARMTVRWRDAEW
ncbi:phage tail family protein [Streptomyces spinoverrucosus]|uniref:phage distal tail protein n=1 Tax=Streptomyces spinoverrucosus TaxID=284043 RepID=UPI0018C36100|nr:phage tail domain-containing protein [Streptomyces spinoverrucosus]MBG0853217.1 phage tail family protein [Streptomyces spinoverrucosus]